MRGPPTLGIYRTAHPGGFPTGRSGTQGVHCGVACQSPGGHVGQAAARPMRSTGCRGGPPSPGYPGRRPQAGRGKRVRGRTTRCRWVNPGAPPRTAKGRAPRRTRLSRRRINSRVHLPTHKPRGPGHDDRLPLGQGKGGMTRPTETTQDARSTPEIGWDMSCSRCRTSRYRPHWGLTPSQRDRTTQCWIRARDRTLYGGIPSRTGGFPESG